MNSMILDSSPLGVTLEPRPERGPTRRVWAIDVLLIEDDPADTSLILDVLKRHPNVSSSQAVAEPHLALRDLESGRLNPNLVLLDLQMPRIDGFEFLRRMRRIPEAAQTPVVILSTSSLRTDTVAAWRSSAVSYVVKPDTFGELQIRLDGVINRAVSGAWCG
jgi:DNA-binding response OmpR family regulator